MNCDLSEKNVERLLSLIGMKRKILILCHNNPDPDCLASAFALRKLIQVTKSRRPTVAYGGHIGRAENIQFIKRLKLPLVKVSTLDFKRFSIICLVDTQNRTGNNSLPYKITPTVVIDHHPLRKETRRCPFYDVRPEYGSTATIMTEYLLAMGIEPDKQMATALFYGLKTDTNNLLRTTSKADINVFNYLLPRIAVKKLAAIENPPVPRSYFKQMAISLHQTVIYGDVIICPMGKVRTPESVAEMAEFLLRMDGIRWTLCFGEYEEELFLSVRTSRRGYYAGKLATRILRGLGAGGGHEKTAGGQVILDEEQKRDSDTIIDIISDRFLKSFNISKEVARPLIS